MTSIYIIFNEWQDDLTGTASGDLVGDIFYLSEAGAWTALALMAEARGITLEREASGFSVEDSDGLTYDEYYVRELHRR